MESLAKGMAQELINNFKVSGVMVEKPYNLSGSGKMPLVQAFLNDFGMFLVMIAGIDRHIYPVSPVEAKYIMDVARISINVDTINYVSETEKLERGSTYIQTVPISFKGIIQNHVVPIQAVCQLYTAAAMELIQIDHKPDSDEILGLIEYMDTLKAYLKENVLSDIQAECEKAFDFKKYMPQEEKQKSESISLVKSGESLKSRDQVIEDIRREYADIYMNCNVPMEVEKVGTDNLSKLLQNEMLEYMIYLATSDGTASDSDLDFIRSILDVNMTKKEIWVYVDKHGINEEDFGSRLPKTVSAAVSLENVQREIQKLMPGKRIPNIALGTTEKLAMLYLKIGMVMGLYDKDGGHGPNAEKYLAYLQRISDYISEKLDK